MRSGWLRAAMLLVLTGCPFNPPSGPPSDGSGSDMAGSDMNSANCFGTGPHFKICLPTLPGEPFDVTTPTEIDTEVPKQCGVVRKEMDVPELCVRAATAIHISASLHAKGTRPLVLLATGDITIDTAGTVDAASHLGVATHGPGANLAALCSAQFGSTAGQNSPSGGGGGAGGSFITNGGPGGLGDGDRTPGGAPGLVVTAPDFLRGGCPGAPGGMGSNAGGTAGNGGGGVYLLADGSLTIHGTVNASGQGGLGATFGRGGGAGAGSGGMIVLYAKTAMDVMGAHLLANGGGGGEGASNNGDGGSGNDPDPNTPLTAATGGSSNADGGDGGVGGVNGAPEGVQGGNGTGGGAKSSGGGGGGGGQGYIHVLSGQTLDGATASPSPN